MLMVRFGEKKIAKEKFYAAKKPIKDWDVNPKTAGERGASI